MVIKLVTRNHEW